MLQFLIVTADTVVIMEEKPQQAYLIYPRLGGLANDMLVLMENGTVLFHIQSQVFAPLGKSYRIYDDSMNEIMVTKQDHTFVFPVHTVFQGEKQVASVGQLGIIPQNYFIAVQKKPRLVIRIPVFGGIFNLEDNGNPVAQIAQHQSKWIVALDTDQDYSMILPLLGVVYREYSIGG